MGFIMRPSSCLALIALTATVCLAVEEGVTRETVSERTARLDRLADEDMPMLHTSEIPPKHDDRNDHELGETETDSEGTKAAAMGLDTDSDAEQEELSEDVRQATAETEGMFDADIRAARAFSSLDDQMDSLKTETDDLKAKTKMAVTDKEALVPKDSKDEDDDLGDADTSSVLDESKGDLLGDIKNDIHVDTTPDTVHKAEDILASMGAKKKTVKKADTDPKGLGESDDSKSSDDDDEEESKSADDGTAVPEDSDSGEDDDEDRDSDSDDDDMVTQLDSAESFIEKSETAATELAHEDLSKNENDLMGRATLETTTTRGI